MNPMDVFKNLGNIQSRMTEMQEKMSSITATGSAGGEMVKITMNGKMEIISVEIAEDVVDPSDIQMLQDLIVAASRDATAKVKEKVQGEVSSLTGDLNIPPGFMGM